MKLLLFISANISQDGKYTNLTFATWMAVNVPGMILNVLVAWIYLIIVFVGLPDWARFGKKSDRKPREDTSETVNKILTQKYAQLGPISFHELAVGILFVFVVMLWLFRDPRFVTGWMEHIPHVEVGDSTAAFLVVLILFILPRNLNFFRGSKFSKPLVKPAFKVGFC
jgi:sodium-dependent dicarboxylate transporter 2/3/5